MTYLLLSPKKDLLGVLVSDDIKAMKQFIRSQYEFGTHFVALSTAEIAELKNNIGKHGRKTSTLPSDFNINTVKQTQL